MAITRTRLNGSASKQLVSASAKKLLGITPIILKSDDPAMQTTSLEFRDSRVIGGRWSGGCFFVEYGPEYDRKVTVWDASSVGSAVGEPMLTAMLPWEPGAAQGYIPVNYGLVIQSKLDCVVIWDT